MLREAQFFIFKACWFLGLLEMRKFLLFMLAVF